MPLISRYQNIVLSTHELSLDGTEDLAKFYINKFYYFPVASPTSEVGSKYTDRESPYKLRISVARTAFRKAWQIIYPILMASDCTINFKILDVWFQPQGDETGEFKCIENGQITVYLKHEIFIDAPNPRAFMDLSDALMHYLKLHGIATPTTLPHADFPINPYCSFRFDGTNPYVPHGAKEDTDDISKYHSDEHDDQSSLMNFTPFETNQHTQIVFFNTARILSKWFSELLHRQHYEPNVIPRISDQNTFFYVRQRYRDGITARAKSKRYKILPDINSPNAPWYFQYGTWMPIADAVECTDCKQKFGVFIQKHHCRICGKIFCSNCVHKRKFEGLKLSKKYQTSEPFRLNKGERYICKNCEKFL